MIKTKRRAGKSRELKVHTLIIVDISPTMDGFYTELKNGMSSPWQVSFEELSDGSGYRIIRTLTTREVRYV
jgi:hypothetical protein